MDHHRLRIRGAIGALLVAVLLTSCGDGEITGGNGNTTSISVRNSFFSPATSTVPTGSTVTWTWNSGATQHNVTFDDGPASANQASGTFQRLFTVAGNYPYECTIHGAAMSGTIVVAVP